MFHFGHKTKKKQTRKKPRKKKYFPVSCQFFSHLFCYFFCGEVFILDFYPFHLIVTQLGGCSSLEMTWLFHVFLFESDCNQQIYPFLYIFNLFKSIYAMKEQNLILKIKYTMIVLKKTPTNQQKEEGKGQKKNQCKICKHIKKIFQVLFVFLNAYLCICGIGCLYFFVFNPVISHILTKQVTFYHFQ